MGAKRTTKNVFHKLLRMFHSLLSQMMVPEVPRVVPGDHPTWAAGRFTGETGAFDVGLLDGLGCWGCWDYEIHSRGSFPKITYV